MFRENRGIGGAVRGRALMAVAGMVLACSVAACAKDIALISNKANHVSEVSLAELVKICKGQMTHWPDGKPVSLVTRDPALPEMRLVVEKVYGASADEVAKIIADANHARVNHPAVVIAESDEALVKKVEATPGAVGLVDVYAITGGVTVLKVNGKLALEPGYLLHGSQ